MDRTGRAEGETKPSELMDTLNQLISELSDFFKTSLSGLLQEEKEEKGEGKEEEEDDEEEENEEEEKEGDKDDTKESRELSGKNMRKILILSPSQIFLKKFMILSLFTR